MKIGSKFTPFSFPPGEEERNREAKQYFYNPKVHALLGSVYVPENSVQTV